MRTATVNTFKAFVLTAPEPLRAQFRGLATTAQISHAAELHSQPEDAVLISTLVQLAGVVRMLDGFLTANKTKLAALVAAWMPELLAEFGVGPVAAAQLLVSWSHPGRCRSAAAFTMLAGTAPLPASSGRVTRHRLNRGGDRQLNRALHIVAIHRLRHDPRTRDYADRRRAAGSTDRETRRCLKNYLARHLWRVMEHHHLEVPPADTTQPGITG